MAGFCDGLEMGHNTKAAIIRSLDIIGTWNLASSCCNSSSVHERWGMSWYLKIRCTSNWYKWDQMSTILGEFEQGFLCKFAGASFLRSGSGWNGQVCQSLLSRAFLQGHSRWSMAFVTATIFMFLLDWQNHELVMSWWWVGHIPDWWFGTCLFVFSHSDGNGKSSQLTNSLHDFSVGQPPTRYHRIG